MLPSVVEPVTASCMKHRFGPIHFNVSKLSLLIVATAASDYSNPPAQTIKSYRDERSCNEQRDYRETDRPPNGLISVNCLLGRRLPVQNLPISCPTPLRLSRLILTIHDNYPKL